MLYSTLPSSQSEICCTGTGAQALCGAAYDDNNCFSRSTFEDIGAGLLGDAANPEIHQYFSVYWYIKIVCKSKKMRANARESGGKPSGYRVPVLASIALKIKMFDRYLPSQR